MEEMTEGDPKTGDGEGMWLGDAPELELGLDEGEGDELRSRSE